MFFKLSGPMFNVTPGLHQAHHPLPARNERGEDRGEGKPIRTLLLSPCPLLHPMEEREKSRSLMQPVANPPFSSLPKTCLKVDRSAVDRERRFAEGLPQGWMRVAAAGEIFAARPERNRHCHFVDQVSRVQSQDMRTENTIGFGVRQKLHLPLRLPERLSTREKGRCLFETQFLPDSTAPPSCLPRQFPAACKPPREWRRNSHGSGRSPDTPRRQCLP